MSTLELEIIERFNQLDSEAKQRVLNTLKLETESTHAKMSWSEWLAWAEDFRGKMREKYGENYYFNSVDALEEAREERLNDLMGGR